MHPAQLNRPRVLLVDDNRDLVDTAAQILELSGFPSRASYAGSSALDTISEFRPDVCLIDLNMPEMPGDELAPLIRKAVDFPIVLVAVTAMSDNESVERIANAGFDRHLVKPVDPAVLADEVKSLWLGAKKSENP